VIGGPIPHGFRSSSGVKLLGNVEDHCLADVYKERNVGVLPFFGIASEGPKLKLIEYMAARLLVLSSPECLVDYPELVAWRDYVPIGSVEETARILLEIPTNPKRFARIAENGHRLVMTRYRWPILLKQYVKFMKRMRSRSPNSRVG
jgi:glycosyltransferase involved in cell wall biosynthesis